MFHADRRTDGRRDMTKLTVAFRDFANAPTNIFNVNIGIKYRTAGVLTSAFYHQQFSIKVDGRVKYLSTDNLKV